MSRLLIVAPVVLLVAAGVFFLSREAPPDARVSATVEADLVRVGSRVGGRVLRVHVEEGARVAPGDALIEFEAFDLDAALAQATANQALRQAEVDRLESGLRPDEIAAARARRAALAARLAELEAGPRKEEIEAARARVAEAEALHALARTEHERAMALIAQGAASADLADQTRARLDAGEAAVRARRAEAAELEEGTRKETVARARAELDEADAVLRLAESGFRAEEIAAARAALAAAAAAVDAIVRRREELVVRAPLAGVIEAIDLEPGDLVLADQPVATILDPASVFMRAYLPVRSLGVAVGDRVALRLDFDRNVAIAGEIVQIATQAEFLPGNAQTPEDRDKLAYRARIRPLERREAFRPGLTGDVEFAEHSR